MSGRELYPLFLAVASIASALNLIESILMIKMRRTWKHFDKLLFSLSIADQLVATTTIVWYILRLLDIKMECIGSPTKIFLLVLVTSEDFSLSHVLAITVDRFFAIKQPIKHHIRMQGRLSSIIIALVWILVALFIAAVLALTLQFGKNGFSSLLKVYSGTMLFIGICYAFAYKKMVDMVLKHSARMHNVAKCPIKQVLGHEHCKAEKTMFITCCLVLLSYIICLYPISIELLARSNVEDLSTVSQLLLLSNSALNPLVYFYKGYTDRRNRQKKTEDRPRNSGSYPMASNKTEVLHPDKITTQM